jgi:hypothetical protein
MSNNNNSNITLNVEQKEKSNNKQTAWNGIKSVIHGFGDIGTSLNTPSTNKRPKISQIPGKRSEMDIVRTFKTDNLKDESMRGRDIRGRKVDIEDSHLDEVDKNTVSKSDEFYLNKEASKRFGSGWRQYFKDSNGNVDWKALKFRLESK